MTALTPGQWVQQIDRYERDSRDWVTRGKKVVKRYKDERPRTGNAQSKSQFNILWSNVQTLLPALYARNPRPDIQRRFLDRDPVGRVAADVLERSVTYFVASDVFGQTMRQAVLDRLLPGRGTVWVRYVPHFRDAAMSPATAQIGDDGAQISDDADTSPDVPQEVAYEEVVTDYVNWTDFGHTAGRTWEEVRGCWRRVFMDRAALVARFGEVGVSVPLDFNPSKDKTQRLGMEEPEPAQATIYEIWDRVSKQAYWLHKDVPQFLDSRDDPLKLEGFWPFPRPLFATLANDTLLPLPDFALYQDQARELDDLTQRISSLTDAIKVAGVYDASVQGLTQLLTSGADNILIPVESWTAFADKGGFKGSVDWMPLDQVASALLQLYEARERVKQDVYEITGMSDIIRGATKASETATAQQIKGNFATMRLSDSQAEVQRFARDVVKVMAQIIASNFDIETIKLISGVKLLTAAEKAQMQMAIQSGQMQPDDDTAELLEGPTWEEVEALLRNQPARCFRLDIETDSTIKADQEAEKQQRVDFLTALGGYLREAVAAAQTAPELAPLLGKMLMFGVRAFPVGKELEGTLDTTVRQLERAAKQPKLPAPDPEAAKAQAAMQLEQFRAQAKAQADQAVRQIDAQLEAAKQQAEDARAAADREAQAQIEAMRLANTRDIEAMRLEHAGEVERLKAETSVIVATIAANAKHEAAETAEQEEAEDAGEAETEEKPDPMLEMGAALQAALEGFTAAVGELRRPRSFVRGPDGKISGVQ